MCDPSARVLHLKGHKLFDAYYICIYTFLKWMKRMCINYYSYQLNRYQSCCCRCCCNRLSKNRLGTKVGTKGEIHADNERGLNKLRIQPSFLDNLISFLRLKWLWFSRINPETLYDTTKTTLLFDIVFLINGTHRKLIILSTLESSNE